MQVVESLTKELVDEVMRAEQVLVVGAKWYHNLRIFRFAPWRCNSQGNVHTYEGEIEREENIPAQGRLILRMKHNEGGGFSAELHFRRYR